MKKTNTQEEKGSIALTIRLEEELAERLRLAAFHQRLKKQHLMRQATEQLLARENAHSAAAVRKKWQALAVVPPEARKEEKLRLEGLEMEALRKFAYDYHLHKQVIVRQALIEYLDRLKGKLLKV